MGKKMRRAWKHTYRTDKILIVFQLCTAVLILSALPIAFIANSAWAFAPLGMACIICWIGLLIDTP